MFDDTDGRDAALGLEEISKGGVGGAQDDEPRARACSRGELTIHTEMLRETGDGRAWDDGRFPRE